MDPLVVSGIMQGVSSVVQGIAAKNQARLDSFNVGTEQVMQKAVGLRESRLIREDFEELMKSNLAFTMTKLNRKITPDLKAAFKTDRDKAESTIMDIDFMTYINQLGYKQEAAATKRKGKEALLAGLLGAGSAYVEYKANITKYGTYASRKNQTLLRDPSV